MSVLGAELGVELGTELLSVNDEAGITDHLVFISIG
jgi:hypothetical protein